jgi:chemotaxis regulatin CheY-phosphate phosphatase CheZ
MGSRGDADQEFQAELIDLLAAARGMTHGNRLRMVTLRARGAVGELAADIHQVLHNLQAVDPTATGVAREIPQVARHLVEIIQSAEEATKRVLAETAHLVEEQARVERGLSRAAEMLRRVRNVPALQECLKGLEELKEIQRRSQGRATDLMSAMEFQELTTRKLRPLISLLAEVEDRLLKLLVLFRIEAATDAGTRPDPIIETCARNESALGDQGLVDQLLHEFHADQV